MAQQKTRHPACAWMAARLRRAKGRRDAGVAQAGLELKQVTLPIYGLPANSSDKLDKQGRSRRGRKARVQRYLSRRPRRDLNRFPFWRRDWIGRWRWEFRRLIRLWSFRRRRRTSWFRVWVIRRRLRIVWIGCGTVHLAPTHSLGYRSQIVGLKRCLSQAARRAWHRATRRHVASLPGYIALASRKSAHRDGNDHNQFAKSKHSAFLDSGKKARRYGRGGLKVCGLRCG